MTHPVYKATVPLILASGSPRRRDFFNDLGLEFRVITAPDAEPSPNTGEAPADYARRAAHAKTMPVAMENEGSCTVGADTIVVLGNEIMGKPVDDAHALDMLSRLAGATHEVITGVCIVLPDGRSLSFAVSTAVTMAKHPMETLIAYIRTGEPADKAGAYAIQGIGAFLVERIDGSWSNVVGLPVVEMLEILTEKNILTPAF
ncbi:Maf family nucleotide pyrophosphatase [Desulfovibrio mangrovi]|uniref:Maf family nucleotide pyrophosphatase n=1 Tax=Desulfovibrio mangrovi TaxID=2976983 RepID=UPI002246D2A4|nr:Maf family nucleotide pyrophosphatase [Desulfovibrio mangrovi]UZP67009.1 Maf family nucleotide pyrophosphatase [Desulfovibrio mangrovi]